MRDLFPRLAACWLCAGLVAGRRDATAQPYPPPPITKDGAAVLLTDYASLPLSSRTPNRYDYATYPPAVDFAQQLGRVNYLRSEPADAPLAGTRFFVCDLNRNFYIFDKSNKTFNVYLDFEATFPKFDNNPGWAGGLVTFQFDPEYATNGIFYTVHTEDPNKGGSASNPVNPNAVLPAGYTATAAVNPPVGSVVREAVLVEWTDTNLANATFEGTARELLRVGFNDNGHPMGDLIFNPRASRGDEDYRNLYIACGDGRAGEQTDSRHYIAQRLDSLLGKTLRLTPDLALRTNLSVVSANGRYRIPARGADPNPFVNTNGARGEIFTYGHRNPHRMAWDAVSNMLLVFEVGLCSFEEVNVVHKGANYGYADREGTKALVPPGGDYSTAPPGYGLEDLPEPDTLPIRITSDATSTTVPVRYPAAEYFQTEGDAMACGFVYRGALVPELSGMCVFGDITTGRLFYCDLAEMIAADDTDPATLATVHELQVVFDSPNDTPDQGATKRRIFDIVRDEYHRRGGTALSLPGAAAATNGNDPDGVPYGGGRADIRLAQGGDGELYLLSKSDASVRRLTGVMQPLRVAVSVSSNGAARLTWNSVPGGVYRLQYRTNLNDAAWADATSDLQATGTTTTAALPLNPEPQSFYRVRRINQ